MLLALLAARRPPTAAPPRRGAGGGAAARRRGGGGGGETTVDDDNGERARDSRSELGTFSLMKIEVWSRPIAPCATRLHAPRRRDSPVPHAVTS